MNTIVNFPLTIQMDKIVREARRLEKKSYELLKKSKRMQYDTTGEWKELYDEDDRCKSR